METACVLEGAVTRLDVLLTLGFTALCVRVVVVGLTALFDELFVLILGCTLLAFTEVLFCVLLGAV